MLIKDEIDCSLWRKNKIKITFGSCYCNTVIPTFSSSSSSYHQNLSKKKKKKKLPSLSPPWKVSKQVLTGNVLILPVTMKKHQGICSYRKKKTLNRNTKQRTYERKHASTQR